MRLLDKLLHYCKTYGIAHTLKKVYYRFLIKYVNGYQICVEKPLEISGERPDECTPEDTFRHPGKPNPENILFSIVVPVYNTPETYLREMLDSLCRQSYPYYEICLADASNRNPEKLAQIIAQFQETYFPDQKQKIRHRKLSANKGISGNSNEGLQMAKGTYIVLMDHDDILHPDALYYIAREIGEHGADFIYSDELSFVKRTNRVQSIHLKPDLCMETLRCNNYICHVCAFQKDLLNQTGGFREQYDGSQDYDLFLRLVEVAHCVRHIPKVLYFWRIHPDSVAKQIEAKPYASEAGKMALEDYLRRNGFSATVETRPEFPSFYRIRYDVRAAGKIGMILEDENDIAEYRKQIKNAVYDITLFYGNEKNATQELSNYEYIFLLRKGYRANQSLNEWATELLECLQPHENKVVAAFAYTEKGKVFHAGYAYHSTWEEPFRPLFRNVPKEDPAYVNQLKFRHNVSLLGGAVLAMKQETYCKYTEKNRGNLFSMPFWFGICLDCLHGCVVTPFAHFNVKADCGNTEAINMNDISWKEFQDEWKHVLSKPDPCLNPGMERMGKYYLLW